MKKLFGLMCAALVAVSTAARSNADLIVSTDLDPAAGIQTTNVVPLNVGETITATFFLQNTAPSTLAAYNFSVQFGSAFEFVGRTESPYGPLTEFDTTNSVVGNVAQRYDNGTVGAGQVNPFGPTQVGTLTLRYIGGADTSITPGLFEPSFDLWFDNDGNEVTNSVVFNGGTVSVAAVPEPSSMALLATAGIGGWVARRRSARKAAK